MTTEKKTARGSGEAWDQLFVAETEDDRGGCIPDPSDSSPSDSPALLVVLASSWADLVVVGALTTAIIGGVAAFRYPISLPALPWAAATALLWWMMTSVVLIRVRRGTPGMLVAGISFENQVAGMRVVAALAAAMLSLVLLGIPLLLGGSSRSILAVSAGSPLKQTPAGV